MSFLPFLTRLLQTALLFEPDEQDGNVSRRNAADARCLTDGTRTNEREFFARFLTQARHFLIVNILRQKLGLEFFHMGNLLFLLADIAFVPQWKYPADQSRALTFRT